MTALKKSVAAMLLSFSSAGLHADARLASVAIEKLLNDVVVGHYQGISVNSFKEAIRFYHSDSPEVARIRIEVSQAAYFQKTATLSFAFIGQCEDLAFGTARHRFLRIAGVKFSEEFAETAYVFRKEGGAWKLWMTKTTGRETPTSREKRRADAFEEDYQMRRSASLPKRWSAKSGSPPSACDVHF